MNEPELFPPTVTLRDRGNQACAVPLRAVVLAAMRDGTHMDSWELDQLRQVGNYEHLRRSKLQVKRTELSEFVEPEEEV